MLTDEDLAALRAMFTELLETYGLQKPPSAAALRMQRYRERKRNESVTRKGQKRNGASPKRNEDVTPVVMTIPLNDGSEFGVTEHMTTEFAGLYPAVDVPQTLREIRGWCLANPTKRKTRSGALKFINSWLMRIQNGA